MGKLNLDKQSLRKFGIVMAAGFLVIASIMFLGHKYNFLPTVMLSLIFLVSAAIRPMILKPIYIFWMKLAFILGWVNTRLILLVIFCLVVTPIGLILKISGKDLLDKKIRKGKNSYWHKKEKKAVNVLDYERQY